MLEGLGMGSQDILTPDAIQFKKKRPATSEMTVRPSKVARGV